MRLILRFLLLVPGLTSLVTAQNFVIQQPDCIIAFTFTATGQSSPSAPINGFDNRVQGCDTWNVTYSNSGFTVVSIALQGALNNAGSPGAYSTGFSVQQAILTGANPMTSTTGGFLWITGYSPWIRILATLTGSGVVNGAAYGWRIPSASTNGGGGGGANVTIVGPLGQQTMANSVSVAIASNQSSLPNTPAGASTAQTDGATNSPNTPTTSAGQETEPTYPFKFNGTAWDRDFVCTSSVDVALSGTGLTEIVVGSGALVVRVCNLFVTSVSGGNPVVNTFTISRGTVTTCAGATELFKAGGVTGLDSNFNGTIRSGAGQSICASESVANSDKVTISYAQF